MCIAQISRRQKILRPIADICVPVGDARTVCCDLQKIALSFAHCPWMIHASQIVAQTDCSSTVQGEVFGVGGSWHCRFACEPAPMQLPNSFFNKCGVHIPGALWGASLIFDQCRI